ncbi:MAG: ATP-binding protein [Verrucomicrobia bacterium]|nr:ATP-binding protein [Verrucomicrobiota bacterium]
MDPPQPAFADVPADARGHLGLLLHSAAFYLIYHLRRRALEADGAFDDVFRDFPFLTPYFTQIRERFPEEISWDGSLRWLREQLEAWQQNADPQTPLRELYGLGTPAVLAFVLAGIIEEEARFGDLLVSVQGGEERRVSVGLIHHVLAGAAGTGDGWEIVRPLVNGGFLEVVNRDAPRCEWVLKVPPVLWSLARGDVVEMPMAGAHYRNRASAMPLADLVLPQSQREALEEARILFHSGRTRTLLLRGMPGTERLRVAEGMARALGRGVLEIDCSSQANANEERWRLAGPFCRLARVLPVFCLDLGPGETFELPSLPGYDGPCAVVLGREGGISGQGAEQSLTFYLEPEPEPDRLAIWARELNGAAGPDLPFIAATFALPGRYIRQCARLAINYATLERRKCVTAADVRQAARAINRHVLDSLATRIDGSAGWGQLIVRETTAEELRSLARRCRYREHLPQALGSDFPGGLNRGVRALFEGPSGTGKTLAARVLAHELGLDLYRVDLAAVVNKYVGETEKNLSRVLGRAEDLNVVLLLDEGDSLMSRRTEVKSANDRYANLETNYLLQRLETYSGIVIITTNAGHAIDSAFRRRIDSVVKFHRPDASERWWLWQTHLPAGHAIPLEAIEEIAVRYALTGGQIRNAVMQAMLLALSRGSALCAENLRQAIQVEHRKEGVTYSERKPDAPGCNDRAIANFLGDLV